MSTQVIIPNNKHDLIPGKNKSLAQIDKAQREKEAAIEIQRAYRDKQDGSPTITPSDRWTDALKRAKVEVTIHQPRDVQSSSKKKWWNAKNVITALKQSDESDISLDELGVKSDEDTDSDAEEQRQREKHIKKMKKGIAGAKTMESPYFLEMIDPHHRYGSHLKAYHTYWLKHTDNKDNFFRWLDEGDGLNVDLADQGRSRKALDTEKVRYLTREQRLHYLVRVDDKGLLRWAKNDKKIDTTTEFKDSEEGIVKADDENVQSVPPGEEASAPDASDSDSDASSSTSVSSALSGTERADRYINDKSGIKKIFLVSPQAVMNRLLRKTTRKNTYGVSETYLIVDGYMSLIPHIDYMSVSNSLSFLHGSRVTSAGLITIRNGQLRKLSPLSGHYRCSTKHFRHFLHAMEHQGVDMSKVYVSRSYTIMIGMEGIGRLRKVKSKVKESVEKIVEKSKEKLEPKKEAQEEGNNASPCMNVHNIREQAEAQETGNLEDRPETDERDAHSP